MRNHERRKRYHRAYYSLDAYDWTENYSVLGAAAHLGNLRIAEIMQGIEQEPLPLGIGAERVPVAACYAGRGTGRA